MDNNEVKWYVLHTFSGYEKVAKENLEMVVKNHERQDRIFEIKIPTETVIEEKDGKKVEVTRNIVPSYIFIKMIYGDDIWHEITRTRGVTGFAGPKGRPLPLTEDEVLKMHLETVECTDVALGDKVELIGTAFAGSFGEVKEIDFENKRAKVVVDALGRDVVLDVSLSDFKKI